MPIENQLKIKSTAIIEPQIKKYRRLYKQRISTFMQSKRASAYTMIILSIFTIAFFSMFAIRPTLKTIIELKRQIKDSRELNDKLQEKIDSLIIAQNEYQLIADFVPMINEALPDQPNLSAALSGYEKIVIDNQSTISALQVQPVIYQSKKASEEEELRLLEKQKTTLYISSKFAGSYEQLTNILSKAFTMRRTLRAKTLEISVNSKEPSVLSLFLDFNFYYLQ